MYGLRKRGCEAVLAIAVAVSVALGSGLAVANPLATENLPIPGKGGIQYFYGQWVPTSEHDLFVIRSISIKPGRIVFEQNQADDFFKVLEETDRYVLAIYKFSGEDKNQFTYRFAYFSLVPAGPGESGTEMQIARCGDDDYKGEAAKWNVTKEIYEMGEKDILEFFNKSEPCNPLLNGSSKEKPWTLHWVKQTYWYRGKGK